MNFLLPCLQPDLSERTGVVVYARWWRVVCQAWLRMKKEVTGQCFESKKAAANLTFFCFFCLILFLVSSHCFSFSLSLSLSLSPSRLIIWPGDGYLIALLKQTEDSDSDSKKYPAASHEMDAIQ